MIEILTGLLGGLGPYIAGALATLAAVWGVFAAGRRSERKQRKINDLEQEARDRETLDRLRPSSERDTVDRLRQGGW